MLRQSFAFALLGALTLYAAWTRANAAEGPFGPSNPFFEPSRLPFLAPPFDRIKDQDYQPAIEAGIAQQLAEMRAIADNPAPPTFGNTLLALERSGRLRERALAAFRVVSEANTNPALLQARAVIEPELAAADDAIRLDDKLFGRIAALYRERAGLGLDAESLRLLEFTNAKFLHAGANLPPAAKVELRKLNEEASTLSNAFAEKLLAATTAGAFSTESRDALRGLSDPQLAAAAQAAQDRNTTGYVVPLQNTTQQPALSALVVRATRAEIFNGSWTRAERGDANDTRATIARLAQLRAERASLLGFASHAAWKLDDQMAKTPEAALAFMGALVPMATAKAAGEARDIQAVIDAQPEAFTLSAWDWNFYAEQVRKARYDLDSAAIKPYFELFNVLKNGVFYAAHRLYGISFKERTDIPVYHPDVRVFEVFDAGGTPLALFYCDYFKRDNKNGGAWMSSFVAQSSLLGTLPVVYNVANLPAPAHGAPALISFTDVTAMFHEFGHALHGLFADTRYPSLSGTQTPRDFVEFPSQFNEHWAMHPAVFAHYARHYQTGKAMPRALAARLAKARNFNEGYGLTELLAAAELDMQWHMLPAGAPLQDADAFETQALLKTHLDVPAVPPRYRSSYFSHIWDGGYSAGYYAYLWTEMLADDAYDWFEHRGGLTRANGDRFRRMVLSRGNTQDLAKMYVAWRGKAPSIEAMVRMRGLNAPSNPGETKRKPRAAPP